MNKLKLAIIKLYGQIIFEINILGIRLFVITKSRSECFNIYIVYLPCFRIYKSKTTFGFNLLILSWMYDLIKLFSVSETVSSKSLLLGKYPLIERVHTDSVNALKICNRNIYGLYKKEAYKFSTAKFKG